MRILVLTSRYTATRDIIGEDFGRQTRLFSALKKLGHDIGFLCADYRKFEKKDSMLHGIRVYIMPFGILHFLSFIKELGSLLKSKKYDLLVATSDPLWGVVGCHYAKKHKTKFLYDLHDNYETYLTYRIPFFGMIDRNAIRKSDIVTTVSNSLKKKISGIRKQDVFVIENGADLNIFRPENKVASRKKLKLPPNAKIIAYAGTLQKMQGTDVLTKAFGILKKEFDDLILVLAGRRRMGSEELGIDRDGVIWLKELNQDGVAQLINASDVAVVPNTSNEFTEYCFPYKVIEYMACNANIVATKVGDVKGILPEEILCKPDGAESLAKKIRERLLTKRKINLRKKAESYSWNSIAKKLDSVIRKN